MYNNLLNVFPASNVSPFSFYSFIDDFSTWITIFLSTPISTTLLSNFEVYMYDSSNTLAFQSLDLNSINFHFHFTLAPGQTPDHLVTWNCSS